jgi:hypothetical protein
MHVPPNHREIRRTNISEVVQAKNTLEATLEALPDAVILSRSRQPTHTSAPLPITMADQHEMTV